VGRYVLYGELASGGMATVHFGRLAGPVGFSRTVAIKRLHPHFAKDPDFVTMFLDEARLCGRIRHPNVVPTLDVVSTEGEIFIVMEYVAGEALSKLLKTAWQQNIPMPPRVAATVMSSVLHGLHAAHQTKDEHGQELGIVHRDVSPQNILVGSDGASRVLDFGVAKASGRLQTTRDGQVKGKIAYMGPEQLSGGNVTRQSDVYAAAVVLWEALAGRRLFDGETEAIVMVRAIEGRIDPPSTFNPAVDAATDAVVMRGLARALEQRFATARDMALAIEQTIGLASPYEVGEWVESVASEEIGRRAQSIADIESSAARESVPRVSVADETGVPPHSQVSSMSVARPALSVDPGGHDKRVFRGVLGLALALAVAGVILGGLGLRGSRASVASAGTPTQVAHEARALALVGAATAKSASSATASPPSSAADPSTGTPPTGRPLPPPPSLSPFPAPLPAPAAAKPAKPNAACDPPFTVDPSTGRKKYKLECLK
jgi:serine/threonine-protein kinase